MKTIRKGHFTEKIVFVDGLWGCGKTMLSPIVAAFDRVELLTYSYVIEFMCALRFLDKISNDGAETMVRMMTDLQLYNTMMSREINFRPTDLSSALNDSQPQKYIQRLFQKGDEKIPNIIATERPILNLTTHHLLGFSSPIFSALDKRVAFIEVVRHPLYMIKQIALNMEKLIGDIRSFTIYYSYKGKELPFYASQWEDLFLSSNYMDKAIYYINELTKKTEIEKVKLNQNHAEQVLTIPFESFVVEPNLFIPKIEILLETTITTFTHDMMDKQKVPRRKYSDGIDLEIYKRCGWEPSKSDSNEIEEFQYRWKFAEQFSSGEALMVLHRLCSDYENKYMTGRLIKKVGYL